MFSYKKELKRQNICARIKAQNNRNLKERLNKYNKWNRYINKIND